MPAYKMGAFESGGFRSLLPPDPRPPSRAWTILACVLAIALGIGSCALVCAMIDGRSSGPKYYTTPAGSVSI